jgi:hypothetical protein
MSRIDDYEPDSIEDELRSWAFSGNIRRAVAGKKGRKFFVELEAALVALPEKRLAKGKMVSITGATGNVCALGAVAVARAVAAGAERPAVLKNLLDSFNPFQSGWELTQQAAAHLNICHPLAYAVVEQNDEIAGQATPEERYDNVLWWVRQQLAKV